LKENVFLNRLEDKEIYFERLEWEKQKKPELFSNTSSSLARGQ
jgi:hypothetical protein